MIWIRLYNFFVKYWYLIFYIEFISMSVFIAEHKLFMFFFGTVFYAIIILICFGIYMLYQLVMNRSEYEKQKGIKLLEKEIMNFKSEDVIKTIEIPEKYRDDWVTYPTSKAAYIKQKRKSKNARKN